MDNDVLKSNQEQMEKAKQMFRETEKQNTQKSLEEKTKKNNTGIVIISIIIVALILFSVYLAKANPVAGGAFIGFIIGPIFFVLLLAIVVLATRKIENKKKQKRFRSSISSISSESVGIATKDNVIKPDSNQTEKSQNVMVKEVDTIKTNDDQLKKIKTRAKAALVISIIVFVFVVVITVPLFRCLKPCQGSDCNVCSTGFGIILPFEMQPGILLSIIVFILISKTSDKLKKYERSPEIDKIKKYCTISRNLLYFSGIFIVVLYCLYFLISVGAKTI